MQKLVATVLIAMATTPAMAQSSLGIQGMDLQFGMIEDESGASQSNVLTRLDVAITDVHGFQGDVGFSDTQAGLIGHLGAHLFMTPQAGQKYGLFTALSDVDGRMMTWGSIGVEGMLALSEDTSLEGRAGMGISDVDSLDYIFGDIAVSHSFSNVFDVETALTVTEFDEAAFRAMSFDLSITARYSFNDAPWGFFATAAHSGLSGRDSARAQTRLGVGLTMSFGHSGGVAPETRPFRSVDPVAPLIRRDLW